MKYQVESTDTGLEVRIDDVAGQEQALLDSIRQCRQSAWACPSGECMNIGTMEERAGDGCIFLTVTSRAGAKLSTAGFEQCLAYMLSQAVNPQAG
jgi:hypothetical protein